MTDSGTPGLPDHLAEAWGVRERPSRGPRPGLSLEKVVAAGIAVADAEGLAGVSMSRVAAEIGAKPMSLYRYISSKDDLLALMVDAAAGFPPEPEGDWRACLTAWAWASLRTMEAHPWIPRIPITGPPRGPHQALWMESGLKGMAETGLPLGKQMSIIILVSSYVRTDAMIREDLAANFHDPQKIVEHSKGLASLLTEEKFPYLSTVVNSGLFIDDQSDPYEDFTFGLNTILNGIQSIVDGPKQG